MFITTIIGNLGADAELHSENGNEFITFKVAHTERRTTTDGRQIENTVWVSCLMNGRNDNLRKYLTQGTRVCVIGDGSLSTYHSQKMQRVAAGLNLFVRSIELVGGKTDAVPSALFDADGVQHNVTKYYLTETEKNCTLYDRSGAPYSVDKKGWISKIQATENSESEQNGNV